MDTKAPGYEGWAILELMGHRRLGGKVSEALVAGAPMLRIDIPSEPPATQFYGGNSIYCLTPTTQEIATALAKRARPEPVQRWELPQLPTPAPVEICEWCEQPVENGKSHGEGSCFDADSGDILP